MRTAWINDCFLAIFEHGLEGDSIHARGLIKADNALLLDVADFMPTGAALDSHSTGNLVVLVGHAGADGTSTMSQLGERPALFEGGYVGYFSPFAVMNMFLELRLTPESRPRAVRFVPLAIYIHESDLDSAEVLWTRMGPLVNSMEGMARSEAGDFYEHRNQRYESYGVDHERGVVVLGSYSPDEKAVLELTRDRLAQRGYDAHLIDGLPETPLMTLPAKVRQWIGGSRFSVMVDRSPSGHVAEYEIAKSQGTILALLRSSPKGSTWMIDGAAQVDVNFIRVFAFETSPIEVIDDAIAWAEAFAEQRIRANRQNYPWKR